MASFREVAEAEAAGDIALVCDEIRRADRGLRPAVDSLNAATPNRRLAGTGVPAG